MQFVSPSPQLWNERKKLYTTPMPPTANAPATAPTWANIIERVNRIIAARGITLRAAAAEMGFRDLPQFHKWVRPSGNVGHEPKATVALHIAAWVEQHQSFIPAGRTEEDAKKKAGKARAPKPAKTPPPPPTEIIKPVVANETIEMIFKRRVKITNGSVKISKNISAVEYRRVIDHFADNGERWQFLLGDIIRAARRVAVPRINGELWQFLLGDVINAGENILGEKYAAVMAATGRRLGLLKQYAYVARNVPPELRTLHPALTYSHLAEVARVPELKGKKTVLEEAAKAATAGNPMTKLEVRLRVDKIVPRQTGKKGRKPGPKRDGKAAAINSNSLSR